MWQHVQVTGLDGATVEDTFRKIAIAEMKHAERLAERLDYLNGVPSTKPDPIFVGGSLIEMLTRDERDEEDAIELYKEAIQAAAQDGDYTALGDCSRRFWQMRKRTSTRLENCLSA